MSVNQLVKHLLFGVYQDGATSRQIAKDLLETTKIKAKLSDMIQIVDEALSELEQKNYVYKECLTGNAVLVPIWKHCGRG